MPLNSFLCSMCRSLDNMLTLIVTNLAPYVESLTILISCHPKSESGNLLTGLTRLLPILCFSNSSSYWNHIRYRMTCDKAMPDHKHIVLQNRTHVHRNSWMCHRHSFQHNPILIQIHQTVRIAQWFFLWLEFCWFSFAILAHFAPFPTLIVRKGVLNL